MVAQTLWRNKGNRPRHANKAAAVYLQLTDNKVVHKWNNIFALPMLMWIFDNLLYTSLIAFQLMTM